MAVAQPHIFSGQGFSLQGDKGRFVLPPQFRKTVKDSSANAKTLCIAIHDRWKCLTGFGLSRTEAFAARLDREEALAAQAGKDYDRDKRASQLFGFIEVPFDDSGRFLLPPHFANLAGIGDQLYFHGGGEFFTIWAPDQLALMDDGWAGAQASCAHLASEAAGRARKA